MLPIDYLRQTAQESSQVRETFVSEYGDKIVAAAKIVGQSLAQGGKVLIFGNGGSAADAQHMAAELVGRLLTERNPLAAIALTTDTSNLTAIGNDYGYEHVFVRQVRALARKGDVVVAISTSGNSKNAVLALDEAKKIGCRSIGLCGARGSKIGELCDIALEVTSGKNSCRIQESHIFAIHSIVDILDRYYLNG
ncbi:MAG: hypothetical protein A3K03_10425 [Bdellovibrionales bacterium RIFOXYD1_FULL_44_7]|nr:MAG: hypothetical protein A3K03_10425 [Bdellovibrionales bacterium RIFOXYD1_FULL_44_7]